MTATGAISRAGAVGLIALVTRRFSKCCFRMDRQFGLSDGSASGKQGLERPSLGVVTYV